MFDLKKIHKDAVSQALERAHFYRLLNEPGAAESICLDVLEIDPDNQDALVALILAITDRFTKGYAVGADSGQRAVAAPQGRISARLLRRDRLRAAGKARLQHGGPGSSHDAYEWLRDAMEWYEKAEAIRPAGNDDPILRWNACARIIMRNHLAPRLADASEPYLE